MYTRRRCPPLRRAVRLVQSRRAYATSKLNNPPARRLNLPFDFGATPLLHHSSETFRNNPELPAGGSFSKLNLFQAVNFALGTALRSSDRVLCFGEDVGFGGVFRCTTGLQEEFGHGRVFNTPITEQGIVGFAIGAPAEGMKPVVEIQFADYVFPALDQIVNEACKFRYREGKSGANLAGMVIRMPCGCYQRVKSTLIGYLLASRVRWRAKVAF